MLITSWNAPFNFRFNPLLFWIKIWLILLWFTPQKKGILEDSQCKIVTLVNGIFLEQDFFFKHVCTYTLYLKVQKSHCRFLWKEHLLFGSLKIAYVSRAILFLYLLFLVVFIRQTIVIMSSGEEFKKWIHSWVKFY